jgi:hypothetical protein
MVPSLITCASQPSREEARAHDTLRALSDEQTVFERILPDSLDIDVCKNAPAENGAEDETREGRTTTNAW